MDIVRIAGREIGEKPKYSEMGALLPVIERFYAEPENEKAFQEWKAEREEQAHGRRIS